jgi:hypothetical protein
MNKKLNAYLEAINEVCNFYPLDLVEGFENRNNEKFADETLKKLTKEIKEKLGEEKEKLETFAWIWGHMVFENTKELIKQRVMQKEKNLCKMRKK